MRTTTDCPRVSICVPNLNTRAFLPERFHSILGQTFGDWELLVYDSYSSDGAWEYITDVAAREPRMRAWQGPREGTPGSWTPCVREARGEYVYIATSDDTMAPDCLEQMVAALDAHPECDVAHCMLQPIDEHNGVIRPLQTGWHRDSPFALSSGPLVDRPHVRRAPLDGVLHLLGGSVYISITQLLIRRSLFDRIGYFERTWGSIGDFNWSMRAGLAASTVHVPETWGGWRVHGSQATAGVSFGSAAHATQIDAMIDDALAACAPLLHRDVRGRVNDLAASARELRTLLRDVAARSGAPLARRRACLLWRILTGSWAAREYVRVRLSGRPLEDWVRRRLGAPADLPLLVPTGGSPHSMKASA